MQASRERLRRQYRPEHIRLLFIGESPPASGRFFYRRDSGLYRAIRDTFRMIDPSITDEMWTEGVRKNFSGEVIVGKQLQTI